MPAMKTPTSNKGTTRRIKTPGLCRPTLSVRSRVNQRHRMIARAASDTTGSDPYLGGSEYQYPNKNNQKNHLLPDRLAIFDYQAAY